MFRLNQRAAHRALATITVLCFCIGLTASAATAQEKPLDKAKISYLGLTCEAPLFVAHEYGYFREEGIEPEFVKLDWSTLKEALGFGKVDATHHLVMYLLKPIEQGLDVKLTAGSHTGCLRLQTGKDSPLRTAQDLKGKKIGVPVIGSPPFLFAARYLAANGVDPNKDVQWVTFPPAELGLALEQGKVDAVGTADPIGTILLESGKVRNIADQGADAPYKDEYCCAVAVSGKIARENPDLAARITRAILRGSKFVQVNPAAAAKLAVEKKYVASTVDFNTKALAGLRYIPSVKGGHDAVLSAVGEMKMAGMLKPSTDPKQLADRAFVSLPGLDDKWLEGVKVEKVAGGGLPIETIAAMGTPAVDLNKLPKSCCEVVP